MMTKIKLILWRILHQWKEITKYEIYLFLWKQFLRNNFDNEKKVIVKFANQEVAKSPFNVYIEGKVGDASKCFAAGPGIEPTGVIVDKPTWFEVDASSIK